MIDEWLLMLRMRLKKELQPIVIHCIFFHFLLFLWQHGSIFSQSHKYVKYLLINLKNEDIIYYCWHFLKKNAILAADSSNQKLQLYNWVILTKKNPTFFQFNLSNVFKVKSSAAPKSVI
jgi:hypothetical protein